VAQEVTVSGTVKGSIRAIRVRLQGGTVEGEIIHRTLSIEDSSIFDGMSRRVENPIDHHPDDSKGADANFTVKAAPKQVVPSPFLVPSALSLNNGSGPPN
jgi:cytoskeletal protein CcmA (bactofilin family)